MFSVRKVILLWLAGCFYIQGLAHYSQDFLIKQENQTLVFKTNANSHKLRNNSHNETELSNTNKTNHPHGIGVNLQLATGQLNKVKKPHLLSKNVSTNRCGDECCPGWTLALKTGTCTRAVCTPKCKNRGVCKKPQTCVCKIGFEGSYCERRNSSLTTKRSPVEQFEGLAPSSSKSEVGSKDVNGNAKDHRTNLQTLTTESPATTTKASLSSTLAGVSDTKSSDGQQLNNSVKNGSLLSWQPLTVNELQAFLQRKGLVSQDKMTTLLTKHLESQKSQIAKKTWKEEKRAPNAIRTPKGEFNIHRQIQDKDTAHARLAQISATVFQLVDEMQELRDSLRTTDEE